MIILRERILQALHTRRTSFDRNLLDVTPHVHFLRRLTVTSMNYIGFHHCCEAKVPEIPLHRSRREKSVRGGQGEQRQSGDRPFAQRAVTFVESYVS
jgi:hypothetical protein